VEYTVDDLNDYLATTDPDNEARAPREQAAVWLSEWVFFSAIELELAERGASLAELQKEGRWKDPSMPALYIRNQEASRGAVARLRDDAQKKPKKTLAASGTVVVESG